MQLRGKKLSQTYTSLDRLGEHSRVGRRSVHIHIACATIHEIQGVNNLDLYSNPDT